MKKEIIVGDLVKRDEAKRSVDGQFIAPMLPPAKKIKGPAGLYAVDVMGRLFPHHVTLGIYTVASLLEDAWQAGRIAALKVKP